jgi:hypothetical protein
MDRHPAGSDPALGCVICCAADRPNDPLLAIGITNTVAGSLTWLHRDCVAAWRAGRIAEAVAALAAMGITGSKGNSP